MISYHCDIIDYNIIGKNHDIIVQLILSYLMRFHMLFSKCNG